MVWWAVSTIVIMGSGQSTNSDTPYIQCEDDHLLISGLGKERGISGDMFEPQSFYNELGDMSSIIHSGKHSSHHLLRQQEHTNDQAARRLRISDLCLPVALDANVHSAGHPMSNQPPIFHGLNTKAYHQYSISRGSAIDDRSSTSADDSSYTNQPTSNVLGSQRGYLQTPIADHSEPYEGARQLANIPPNRLYDSAPHIISTNIEHRNSAHSISHVEKNGGGAGSARHFMALSSWPSLNNTTTPNSQKQNTEIVGDNLRKPYGVPPN
jgi:hypothetical protein